VAKITNAHVTRVQEAVLVITGMTAAPAQGSLHGGSTQTKTQKSPGGGPILGASILVVGWVRGLVAEEPTKLSGRDGV